MAIRERPLFSDTYSDVDNFIPEPNSIYVYGESPEDRSFHVQAWKRKIRNVKFVRIVDQTSSTFLAEIDGTNKIMSLRSLDQLRGLWRTLNHKIIYIDITGLSHHVWAPLLLTSLPTCQRVMAVYVEPANYRFSSAPKEGDIFDLSERINGISPIPGFISLKEPTDEDKVCFVPLLGFEGTRFSYLIEQVQPPGDRILPIVGVPGFLPEYPFFAYHGNQLPLLRTHAWRNVRFAIANCPFSLFYVLGDIADEYPDNFLKIAPIGTKPHALGSVLYGIVNNNIVELVYDHPIRKAKRTEGVARLFVYHVSEFISSSAPL